MHRCSLPPGARLRWCGSSRGTSSTVCPIPSVPPPSGAPSPALRDAGGPTSTRSRSSTGAGCGRGSRTRRVTSPRPWTASWCGRGPSTGSGRRRATRSSCAARCSSAEVIELPGGGEQRVAAVASVVTAGERWSVATAHLSLEPAVARRQLRVTLDALGERPKPWVLAGDLNLRAAPAGGRRRGGRLRPPRRALHDQRAHGAEPPARPRPRRRCARRRRAVWPSCPCSDHLAVWADLHRRSYLRSSAPAGVGLDEAVGLLVAVLLAPGSS